MQTTVKKRFTNFPFAHRQHTHEGHCSKIHGHSWDFEFEFAARERDENGFIIDFGNLKWLKNWLDSLFDHTLVLSHDDPLMKDPIFLVMLGHSVEFPVSIFSLTTVGSASCEGIANFLNMHVKGLLWTETKGRVSLVAVTVFESPTNSATIRNGES